MACLGKTKHKQTWYPAGLLNRSVQNSVWDKWVSTVKEQREEDPLLTVETSSVYLGCVIESSINIGWCGHPNQQYGPRPWVWDHRTNRFLDIKHFVHWRCLSCFYVPKITWLCFDFWHVTQGSYWGNPPSNTIPFTSPVSGWYGVSAGPLGKLCLLHKHVVVPGLFRPQQKGRSTR